MPQRTATVGSLPEAFGMVEAMRADGPGWGTGCRRAARQAPAGIIRGGMAEDVDRRFGSPEGRDGTHPRRLLREPRDIGPDMPRTRRYRPTAVLGSCARRARERELAADG